MMIAPDNREIALGPVRIDRRLLALAGVMSLIVYGYELFHFTLSIDEEVHTFETNAVAAWTGQGRWAMALLNGILPPIGALPFVSTLLFCAGLSLAAALTAPLVMESEEERGFFVILLVVSPVWPHLVEFNTLSFGIGIGLVAVALAVRASFQDELRSLAAGGLALAFAIGIYQTFSLAFLVLALLAVVARPVPRSGLEPRRALSPALLRVAAVFVAGMAIYAVVNAVARRLVPPNSYVDVFLNWRDFLVDTRAAVRRTLGAIGRILGGGHAMYLGAGLVFEILAIAGLMGFAIDTARRTSDRAARVALFLCAVLVAVAPEIVAAGYAPVRTFTPLPFLFAVVATYSLRIRRARWPQWTALSLAAVTGTWISVTLFYSDAVARQRDSVTAVRLAERIEEAARPVFTDRIPLVMVGYLEPAEDRALRRVEVFGTSFFEHDQGNPFRMAYFLRLLGIQHLDPQPVTSVIPIAREVEGMPTWPKPGSVAVVGGKLVVKFGPPSFTQQREIDAARVRASAAGPPRP